LSTVRILNNKKGIVMNKSKNIENLVSYLEEANEKYRNGTPIISDKIFDSLEDILKEANPSNEYFNKISDDNLFGCEEKLTIKMGSQTKALSIDGLNVLYRRIPQDVCFLHASEKIDGASIELTYISGNLVKILTRGNGLIGVNVTKTLSSVPSILKNLRKELNIVIRGEIYMPKSSLVSINEELELKNKSPFKNTRNGTVGIMKTEENQYLAKYLAFKAFDYVFLGEDTLSNISLECKFDTLRNYGFDTPKDELVRIIDIPFYFDKVKKIRANLDYDIDGIVFSVNDSILLKSLGSMDDGKCLKGQMALKFEASTEISTIKDIEWSFEGGQYICPIATIDPVDIEGASISRVSLKSPQWLKDNKVGIGTTVSIQRSGGVIPCISEIISNRVEDIKFPNNCSYCGDSIKEDGARIYCPNEDCPAKEASRITHFFNVLNIKGVGFKTTLQYVYGGIHLSDFLTEDYNEVDNMMVNNENISVIIWKKIRKQLENISSLSLPEALSSLNITSSGGTTTWKEIIGEGFNTIDKIRNMSIEEISECGKRSNKKIGLIRANKIFSCLHSKRMEKLLDKVYVLLKEKSDEKIINPSITKISLITPIVDRHIVMTGEARWGRKQLSELLENNGNTVQSSLSKQTNLLICDSRDSTSSKTKKAKSLGIEIKTYDEVFN